MSIHNADNGAGKAMQGDKMQAQGQTNFEDALFSGLPPEMADKFRNYFFTSSKRIGKLPALKSRLFALYDPFADRRIFAAGIRYCLNVYAGCNHCCKYCYIASYIRQPHTGRSKAHFVKKLEKDIRDISALDLPPIPLHISNSTDCLQDELESRERHMLHALRMINSNTKHFSPVTILTKNPTMLLNGEYLELIKAIPRLRVQVSLIFWSDEARRFYEPKAPSVESRKLGISELRRNGIEVHLRIDPLFPRNPLPNALGGRRMEDFGIPSAHSLDDIRNLIKFAGDAGCRKIIHSPLKIVRHSPLWKLFSPFYGVLNGGKPVIKGGSMRMPMEYYHGEIARPVSQICRELKIPDECCKENLIRAK